MLVSLTQAAYTAQSLIANAQRCVNLYPEINVKDSPVPTTHYLTPGLTLQATTNGKAVRWQYTGSNGKLYTVTGDFNGSSLYVSTPSGTSEGMGTTNLITNFPSMGTTPVYMADNGLVLVLVDGSTTGWVLDLQTLQFAKIIDPNFLGATKVDYLDTFFLFNQPRTKNWYSSLSEPVYGMFAGVIGTLISGSLTAAGSSYLDGDYNPIAFTGGTGTGATGNIVVSGGQIISVTIVAGGSGYLVGDILSASISGGSGFQYTVGTVGGTAFNALDIASKSTFPDPIVNIQVMHGEVWIIGTQTTEVWFNAGASPFAFQIFPGVFIEHGCAAPYSVAKQDLNIYWLSTDRQGQGIILKGNSYAAHRISTFAIEQEIAQYSKISDARGWTYQQEGHTFYVLTFPTADKTWVWDESTQLWHERASIQYISGGAYAQDGDLHKVLYNSSGICGGFVYVGDYLGNIYLLDPTAYTEVETEIPRIRSFPHLLNSQKRVSYLRFIADMEVGTDDPSVTGDNTSPTSPPSVALRWSDDRGKSYNSYVYQSLGALGQYLTNIQWQRLGIARDRVFEISWSVDTKTALNGAWVEFTSGQT